LSQKNLSFQSREKQKLDTDKQTKTAPFLLKMENIFFALMKNKELSLLDKLLLFISEMSWWQVE